MTLTVTAGDKDGETGGTADRHRDPMTDALQPNPMEIMRSAAPEGARTYLEHRAAIMDNPELQAVPLKYKLLVGIGVAAALQSSTCTVQRSKQAMQAGATREEIVEAVLVARLMKAATVNDTAADALAWLAEATE